MAKRRNPPKDQCAEPADVGRPTSYRPEYAELAHNYCLLGATNAKLAELFDVCVATIANWLNEHEEFLYAVKEGREVADANVAKSLYQRAIGYTHSEEKVFCNQGEVTRVDTLKHYPPDTESAKWWLRNRQSEMWRESQRLEHTGADGEPLKLSDDEIARRYMFLLASTPVQSS